MTLARDFGIFIVNFNSVQQDLQDYFLMSLSYFKMHQSDGLRLLWLFFQRKSLFWGFWLCQLSRKVLEMQSVLATSDWSKKALKCEKRWMKKGKMQADSRRREWKLQYLRWNFCTLRKKEFDVVCTTTSMVRVLLKGIVFLMQYYKCQTFQSFFLFHACFWSIIHIHTQDLHWRFHIL